MMLYRQAEEAIERARKTKAKKLYLKGTHKEDAPKLVELPEILSQLTNLEVLDVSNNAIETLPDWIGKLAHLTNLNVSDNRLTTLPSSLANLAHLEILDVSNLNYIGRGLEAEAREPGNSLREFPPVLQQLTQLRQLNISNVGLLQLPEWILALDHLLELDVSHNQLTAIPASLCQLKNLKSLELSFNRLGWLPEEIGSLSALLDLDLSRNELRYLPIGLCDLKQLKRLNLFSNKFESLPEWLGELAKLEILGTGNNTMSSLPESLRECKNLKWLDMGDSAGGSPLRRLPNFIRHLPRLQNLTAASCDLEELPDWIGEIASLKELDLSGNRIRDVPVSLVRLKKLERIDLTDNPLVPELSAAYKEGFNAVRTYIRAKTDAQIALNEAKLVLIGEGDVGKSSLLGALRDDAWVDGNPTTHGIEIKPVTIVAADRHTEITLNGWDFGGQRVYRPTHQLFFSAPAIYLVVWKPREGPQQGFVKEWISLVKHRAPDAKIIVVATHGGPKQRQPDIDRQEIWDAFGKDLIVDFVLVDSKPSKTGKRKGISELKELIAGVAGGLPGMGRQVPKRWEETRRVLRKTGDAYLPLAQVLKICADQQMDFEEANDFIRISHRLGHIIHYEHDPILQNIVVLKPDWLSTAISFVLDDERTRADHGLISFERLGQLWNDPKRKERYPKELHSVFLGLMERYDLSYRVPDTQKVQTYATSLIAQLVPDVRPPEQEFRTSWPVDLPISDEQQSQICRIVDARNGQSAAAEGLFYQLIVRLHKYSLGRINRDASLHWQRGLVLDDEYNGRALLENVGNDVRITVRAAYPERFLSVLTHEVKWLVENFWKGLRCEVTVPCMAPCGKGIPGTGLFEVEKLVSFKRQGMQLFPCFVSGCNQAQDVDSLLRNAPTARRTAIEVFLDANFKGLKSRIDAVSDQLAHQGRLESDRFNVLDQNDRRILSQVEDAYTGLMQALIDEAREGPRLFGFEPKDRRFFSRPKWISAKFKLTLWCEHSRLPLPVLNGANDSRGVYELDLPREWVLQVAPYLKLVTGLLSLVVPVAGSAMKLELDDAAYKGIEKQLEFGQKSLESALKGTEKAEDWATQGERSGFAQGNSIDARGAVLRQLHAWLKQKDPSFGGLVRVQNRRQEFLWVHPKFESEY
jgi:Leucine-rich repeat (LRR) protein